MRGRAASVSPAAGARLGRIGSFSFTPGIWPTLGAALLIALTLSLARWQTNRGDEKAALQRLLEARFAETPVVLTGSVPSAEPLVYRHVRAAGEWIAEGQVFIDNQVLEGRAGYHVITPLRISPQGDAVLVNRGWIARGPDYPRPPAVPVPSGPVKVSGTATVPPRRVLELAPDTVAGNVWQNLSIERYRARTKIAALPVVVLADSPAPGLAPVRERPDTGIARHREYALTWLSLAITALALWLGLNVKRRR
jgi:surfeit locus 1 family protein